MKFVIWLLLAATPYFVFTFALPQPSNGLRVMQWADYILLTWPVAAAVFVWLVPALRTSIKKVIEGRGEPIEYELVKRPELVEMYAELWGRIDSYTSNSTTVNVTVNGSAANVSGGGPNISYYTRKGYQLSIKNNEADPRNYVINLVIFKDERKLIVSRNITERVHDLRPGYTQTIVVELKNKREHEKVFLEDLEVKTSDGKEVAKVPRHIRLNNYIRPRSRGFYVFDILFGLSMIAGACYCLWHFWPGDFSKDFPNILH